MEAKEVHSRNSSMRSAHTNQTSQRKTVGYNSGRISVPQSPSTSVRLGNINLSISYCTLYPKLYPSYPDTLDHDP